MSARSLSRNGAILASALVASVAGSAPAALAEDSPYTIYGQRPGTKLKLVSYRDLNLVYRDHQNILYRRVGHAVRQVCSFDQGNIPTLDNDYRVCAGDAWQGVRPQISNAIVRAYQYARIGRAPRSAGYIVVDKH